MKRKEEREGGREEGRELISADGGTVGRSADDGQTVHFQIEFFAWKTPGTQINRGRRAGQLKCLLDED